MNILQGVLRAGADMIPGASLVRTTTGQTVPVAVPLDFMLEVEFVLKENGFEALHSFILADDELFCFEIPTAHWPFVKKLLYREFGFVWE